MKKTLRFRLVDGLLIAMMLFNTLYTNRSAVGVHSLPVTRSQLFFNYWLAALAAAAVPMALVCLLTLPLLLFWNTGCFAELGLLLVSSVGSFIWNFSFAAFCAMFTGQIFWIILRVEVESPQRSLTSKVGSKEMVNAQPG